jgi:hypothetical protein
LRRILLRFSDFREAEQDGLDGRMPTCATCKRFYAELMQFPNPHVGIDAENIERDRQLASLLRREPGLIELAKRDLETWKQRWGVLTAPWKEWQQLLNMLTTDQLADFLESQTPKANRLRQSSPFLGVLTQPGRGITGS